MLRSMVRRWCCVALWTVCCVLSQRVAWCFLNSSPVLQCAAEEAQSGPGCSWVGTTRERVRLAGMPILKLTTTDIAMCLASREEMIERSMAVMKAEERWTVSEWE